MAESLATSADAPASMRSFPIRLRVYAEVFAMVSASTMAGVLIAPIWGTGPVDLLYLPAVLAAASFHGLRPALFSAIISTLAYNFFFTHPVHTFRIARPDDFVTVVLLFLVAVVTSQLAARMRTQTRIAKAAAARNATIAGLARRLLSCSTENEIGSVACSQIAALFDSNAVLVVARDGVPAIIASAPGEAILTPSDIAAAAFCLEYGEPAGRGAGRLDPAEWLFYPVRSERAMIAALGLARDDGTPAIAAESLPLLTNLLDQVALALARTALEDEVRGLDQLRERDRLRGALLSSVGHDLRTPLTAIIAAAAELRRAPKADGAALIGTLVAEADKLDRYISNLLDMARIEAGNVKLRSEPTDLVDAISGAIRDLRQNLAGHPVSVELGESLPLVRADPELLHHCLINILDNAARHSDAGTRIRVLGTAVGDGVSLSIIDEGPGLSMSTEGVFETFSRISGSDRSGGTGLGLAIAKGFAHAMGVTVDARNREDRPGAIFTLHFSRPLIIDAVSEADVERRA